MLICDWGVINDRDQQVCVDGVDGRLTTHT